MLFRSALVVFPELGLSGYSTRDLLHDQHLLEACETELLRLAREGRELAPLAIVGLPLRAQGALYNVAAVLQAGRVLAVIPKAYLPNYREFEETRWFRPGREVPAGACVHLGDETVPFGTDVLLQATDQPDIIVGVEICEDYWVQLPPSAFQVGAGALVIANLSASNFTVGKAGLRRNLALAAADRGKCAYIYVAAGPGESSTDLAFDADALIVENGRTLAESERFSRNHQLLTVDVDIEELLHDRMVTNSFWDCAREHARAYRMVPFTRSEEQHV